MRIRTYRSGDIPTLLQIQHSAAEIDGVEPLREADFVLLLAQPAMRNGYYIFLITDDDDELNTWGQGESLDGVEGEVVGYTILQLSKDQQSYRFRSHGTVLPEHRQQGAGHALLLCALNHARMQAIEFVAEARQNGLPIYFEVLLPGKDPTTASLASMFELEVVGEASPGGLCLYRTEL